MNKEIKEEFKKLRESFTYIELQMIDDKIYFKNELVEDSENNIKIAVGENFYNIFYGSKDSICRVLSNLYPIKFRFKGKIVNSIEGVLQGVKYKNRKIQNLVFKYSGIDAYHTRGANIIDDWTTTQTLYYKRKPMARDSEEYQNFLDDLYLSALKNPIHSRALLSTQNKYLLHHIGCLDKRETVLTRYEYESRLYASREILKKYPHIFNIK